MHPNHPQIQEQWTPADDTSNRLELAPTDQAGVLAIRDSFDPNEVVFATEKQLISLTDAVQKGRMRNLLR